ncbi:transposase [Lactobacillus taiwanensis]|uniref:transposase n=1 Tax=Lactobacillus taiwanensis TaxID=508451 RepID=UPI0025B1AD4A|nr:transposase [Lactobacillus taiwanensis]
MSRKSKFSYDAKLNAVQQYLNSRLSYADIGKSIGVNGKTIENWVNAFKSKGPNALKAHKYNQSYTEKFKLKCIKTYLNGQGSYKQVAYKYGLRSATQLKNWVSKYNSHQRFKNYYPTQRFTR